MWPGFFVVQAQRRVVDGGIRSFLQQCSDFTHMRSALIGRTARICADLWMSDMLWSSAGAMLMRLLSAVTAIRCVLWNRN